VTTDALLSELYGEHHRCCPVADSPVQLVLSSERPIDLVELEQLCSLLRVGLWRHDPWLPKLVGFARCTGDGVVEATVWDVAVHPHYQGNGLGKALMAYVLEQLRQMEVERVSLFADPGVVDFYAGQGWDLEPGQRRCAFWYSP
jgi:ribosomal protein S18 acetylase RimI-like enzyme